MCPQSIAYFIRTDSVKSKSCHDHVSSHPSLSHPLCRSSIKPCIHCSPPKSTTIHGCMADCVFVVLSQTHTSTPQVLNQASHPHQFAEVHNELGSVRLERSRGDRPENLAAVRECPSELVPASSHFVRCAEGASFLWSDSDTPRTCTVRVAPPSLRFVPEVQAAVRSDSEVSYMCSRIVFRSWFLPFHAFLVFYVHPRCFVLPAR